MIGLFSTLVIVFLAVWLIKVSVFMFIYSQPALQLLVKMAGTNLINYT